MATCEAASAKTVRPLQTSEAAKPPCCVLSVLQTDVIQRLTDEKAVIEEQLRQERLQREELSRQLQALEEKQKAAERALEEGTSTSLVSQMGPACSSYAQEKKDIEERLRKEKQHDLEHQQCAEKEQLRQDLCHALHKMAQATTLPCVNCKNCCY
eukprot:symbB.v1.2.030123.t1/scaffold3360.1/size58445/5